MAERSWKLFCFNNHSRGFHKLDEIASNVNFFFNVILLSNLFVCNTGTLGFLI